MVAFLSDDVANDQILEQQAGVAEGGLDINLEQPTAASEDTDDVCLEPKPREAGGLDIYVGQPTGAEAPHFDLDIVVEASGALQTASSEEQAVDSASAEAIELQQFNTSGVHDGIDASRLEVGPLISECKLITTLEFKSK